MAPQESTTTREGLFDIKISRHFTSWLAEQQVSLAFTHPPLKLLLIGLKPSGELSVYERTFPRCLGIAADGTDSIYVSSRYQIWRLDNALPPGRLIDNEFDKQYIPRKVYTTGTVGTHDVAVDHTGRVIFVNTRFGCLATVHDQYSFVPLWRPRHLATLPDPAPGDRCHLNGLAMKEGRPAYVTSVSQTTSFDGWRDARKGGGVVIDVPHNEVVADGFSMPHSPRWYRDKLWVTNSGTGHFGYVDLQRGCFEPLMFGPGFLRGLCFVGDYAIVGSSKPREGDLYSGLGLDENLRQHNHSAPRLGLFVVDLRSGQIAHWLLIEGEMREIYDVIALPGVRQPSALGIVTNEIDKTIVYATA